MEYFEQQKRWSMEVMKKDRIKRAQSTIVKVAVAQKVMASLSG